MKKSQGEGNRNDSQVAPGLRLDLQGCSDPRPSAKVAWAVEGISLYASRPEVCPFPFLHEWAFFSMNILHLVASAHKWLLFPWNLTYVWLMRHASPTQGLRISVFSFSLSSHRHLLISALPSSNSWQRIICPLIVFHQPCRSLAYGSIDSPWSSKL